MKRTHSADNMANLVNISFANIHAFLQFQKSVVIVILGLKSLNVLETGQARKALGLPGNRARDFLCCSNIHVANSM